MIVARLAALATLAFALGAQPKPTNDVDGWDKIKWGTTIAEARSAYGVTSEPESKDNWILLKLNPVKIADIEMGVEVGAPAGEKTPAAGKINSVKLWSFFGIPSSAPKAGPQDFDTLKAALIREYGQPANEETKRGENFRLIRTVLWNFPSTSILLTLEQSSSLPTLGNIYLDYSESRR